MTIADALTRLVAELAEGGVPDPLDQRFRLAFIFDDLCRIAGEALPAEVAAALDAPICRPADISLRNENRRAAVLAD